MNWRITPPRFGLIERVMMRVLFALVVWKHIPPSLDYLHPPTVPNGLARIVDLHFLFHPATFAVLRYLLAAALLLYVLRLAWSVVLPYLTFLSVAVGSVNNSTGAIGHMLQIVSLVLLAQTAAHFRSRFKQPEIGQPLAESSEDRVIFWSQQTIAACYLVAALTKLIRTGGAWFFQGPLIAVQIVKTTEQDYYNRLEPGAYESGAAVAAWVVQHPLLVGLALSGGLLLELTAPLALFGRRFALVYGLSLVAFHESIDRVMKLRFPYHEALVWIYLVNVPFWLIAFALWTRRRIRR